MEFPFAKFPKNYSSGLEFLFRTLNLFLVFPVEVLKYVLHSYFNYHTYLSNHNVNIT